MIPSTTSRGRSRQVASSVRPARKAGMTTTMRLPLSMRQGLILARDAKRDQIRVLESRRPKPGAERGLAVRRVCADRFGLSLAGLEVRLLPDDVIDIPPRERFVIGEMYR